MSKLKVSGIFPPLTTPFDDRGEVDYVTLRNNVQAYNETGLSGYVALGSNGEAVKNFGSCPFPIRADHPTHARAVSCMEA